jgi:hypothetical protein
MSIAISGTVRITLAELADQQVPSDLHVEIDLADTWPDSADLDRLRMLAWRRGGNLAIVGSNPTALAYVVKFLRERAGLDEAAPGDAGD